MTDYPERQTARSAGWARGIATFALVLLATDWIGHHYGLVETVGFLWVLAIVPLLAALALMLAARAFSRIWAFGDLGGRDVVVATILALLILSPYAFAAYRMLAFPPLRDISTDVDDPPPLDASNRVAGMNADAPQPSPGEISQQRESYPLVTSHRYNLSFDETLAAVELVLQSRGWAVAGDLPAAGAGTSEATIDARAASFGLELPVDVAIRISSDADAVLVDMRSASRYGRHDLGDNAARIVSFLSDLDQQVAAQSGVPR